LAAAWFSACSINLDILRLNRARKFFRRSLPVRILPETGLVFKATWREPCLLDRVNGSTVLLSCEQTLYWSKLMRLDAIAIGHNPPKDLNVVIEVPIGGEPIKYEMDKASGALFVDRFLYTSMRYPGNYGFVPHTLSADGDPIDVLVCNTRAIAPGAVINCRPVGVLLMEDDGGGDEKLIAVPSSKLSQRYDGVKTTADLPKITLNQIEHFFAHYKDLEPGKWVKIKGWGDVAMAEKMVIEAIARAKK
jgi:inorganic pyrophosphatase